MSVKVAVVQAPPVLLDRAATISAMLAHIAEAAAAGARLIIFPEAYIPGYPTWVWRLTPGGDMALAGEIHARLREQAVDIGRGDLKPLTEAAVAHGVTVVCGMHELDSEFSGTTLFNTVVMIGPDGTILNRHRKLLPTNPERMVWGRGDARGLRVIETPVGRIGCLICWENYLPLARYALYAQNLEILVAPTWDCGDAWIASMRHIAREGGCWVIATGTAIQGADVPGDFPGRERLFTDNEEWLCDGGALIVRPFGTIEAGPHNRDKSVLYCEIEPSEAPRSRRSLDVAGHYARPDVFSLRVNRMTLPPVEFRDN
jgi:nitrilase